MIAMNQRMIEHLPGEGDIQRSVLDNGIVLLSRYHPHSPSIVVNGFLSSGSLYDPPEKLGRANFTALGIMRGTQKKNFSQIYESLEYMGASLMFGGSVHSTSFGGRALAEDLPSFFELLAEGLREPTFPTEQIERLRALIMASLAIRAQDTSSMASMAFDKHIYADHPYASPEDGFVETIKQITRDDLAETHAKYFGPQGLVLAVTGGVDADAVKKVVEDTLGDWINTAQEPDSDPGSPVEMIQEIREHINIPGKSQTDIVMGNQGFTRTSEDFFAATLANNILGQFGMMGRIGYSVREKAGLAYYASSGLNASKSAGAWEISAGVNPNNVEKAIDLIKKEVQKFIAEGPSDQELEESQANYIGRLPLSMESNQGVAAALINIERFELGINYYRDYPAKIASITKEAAQQVAAKYLKPQNMAIISAGVKAEG
ncbi:MAG: insulinase family protein [Anaerolineaceae bacterium]|nr:insulinase family protein [Anaerolineaceae bacterium]